MKTIVNSYNLFEEEHSSTILYHAVAENEDHVKELAASANIDIEGLTIELERRNVRTQLGEPFTPYIEDALIH